MSVGDSQNTSSYSKIRTYIRVGGVSAMIVNKAYKFRIYPNKKQMELIHKTIGCVRFTFNFFLGKQKENDVLVYC